MIPRTRRAALLTILEFERRVKELAIQAYSQWLPIARAAVLGENLTAAADDEVPPGPPPDPEAIALTEADWESILAGVFLPALAELLWAQMTAEMIELGITVPDLRTLIPDSDDDEEEPRRPRRRQPRQRPDDTSPPPDRDRAPDDQDTPDDEEDEDAPDREPDRDRDRDRDDEPDDDEDLTPQFVARVPTVQEWVDAYLASVHNRMVRTPDTAFDLIRTELIEATREGESIQEQRERVARILDAENLDTFGGRRAALVARTETAGALNGARLESARVMAEITGEELHKVWLATIDTRTRSTHFAADGQRQPLDGEFTMASGATLRWPGDPTAPASEVCNCRCALMILAVDEELPAEDDRHTERGPGDATVRNREGRTRAEEIERRREEEGITRARDDPNGVGEITAAAPPPERIRTMQTFRATLAHLGVMTDDRRMLAADMDLRFASTPMPLMWQERTAPGHDGAVAVGVVDTIELVDGQVEATGHFLDTEDAAKALVQIREGITNPSIDPADVEWELRDEAGEVITDFDQIGFNDRVVETYTAAVVRAATLVNIPAFGTTTITLTETDIEGDRDDLDDVDDIDAAMLAAATAARFRPDGHLFSDPGFTEPTPLHITDDGRVQGHLAVFGTCHVGRSDRCVTPPHSATGYAHFHVSSVQTSDDTWLPVGRLTVGGGHADDVLGARAAAEHYDNTGACWAYVRAGEDAHGIWVSGVLHPDATDAQVRDGLSAPLSGDWRRIGGNLELVAALSVNTPGFPVLRGRDDEHGRTTALVAAIGPRRRAGVDTSLLREVARETVAEYLAQTRRHTAAQLIAQRRRSQAIALVAAIRSRKG